jgi:hypothetical protein
VVAVGVGKSKGMALLPIPAAKEWRSPAVAERTAIQSVSASSPPGALVVRLRTGGFDVVELNPAAVMKLVRNSRCDDSRATPVIWGRWLSLGDPGALGGHRRRKVFAQMALANQVIGQFVLIFLGLHGCLSRVLSAIGTLHSRRDL